jgi:hypothetical protein
MPDETLIKIAIRSQHLTSIKIDSSVTMWGKRRVGAVRVVGEEDGKAEGMEVA